MENPDNLAAALRAALSTEQFAAAQKLAAEYAQAITGHWRGLPPGDPELARSWQEARKLFEWARGTALAQKSQLARQLEAIEPLAAFLRIQSQGRQTTFEMRG